MTNLPSQRRPRSTAVTPRRATADVHPVVNPLGGLEQHLPDDVLAKLRETGLLDQISAAKDYEAASRATSTRDNYARSWDTFVEWCEQLGAPSLPAQPELVAVYTAYLADTGGHGIKADGSRSGRRPGTVSNHLTAIRAVHVDAGHGDPTSHPAVRRVLAGIKRVKGTRAQAREPMTYDLLARTIYAIDVRHDLRAARDRVLLAAADVTVAGQWRSQPDRDTSVTSTQLAAIAWQDVSVLDEDHAVLTVPSRSNRRETLELTVHVRPGNPLCLVAALRSMAAVIRELTVEANSGSGLLAGDLAATVHATWQSGSGVTALVGPLLPSLDKRGLPKKGSPSRQQLDARLGRAAQFGGVSVGRTTAPRNDEWTHADRLRALAAVKQQPLGDLRDRALLLMGWHLASRRSNLTWLRVGEVTPVDGGLDVHFRRSKTDQEQAGRTLAVVTHGGRFCPVAAWDAWYAAMRTELGDRLDPDFPAFPALTKDGTAIGEPREVLETRPDGSIVHDANGEPISRGREGLCGDEINYLVKKRAADAGLKHDEHGRARPWGAHSLRRGWLTEGARQGIGLAELMAHSGHVSHESVLAYIQAANRWSTEHAAPLKMRYDLRSTLGDDPATVA
jgi:hypothetical protein